MSTFYCRLAKNKTKHIYQFLNKDANDVMRIDFNNKNYTIGFYGNFKNIPLIEKILNKEETTIEKEKCVLGLYESVRTKIKDFISEDAFLLIDDEESVLIYSEMPLYYQREKAGEIYISSEKTYLNNEHVYQTDNNACLLYFNDNLKTLR